MEGQLVAKKKYSSVACIYKKNPMGGDMESNLGWQEVII